MEIYHISVTSDHLITFHDKLYHCFLPTADPYTAAEDFLETNNLPSFYLDQVFTGRWWEGGGVILQTNHLL